MLEVIAYYWPRLIVALLFVLFSLNTIKDKFSIPQQLIRGVVLFFISCPVISITTEVLNYRVFNSIIAPRLNFQETIITAFLVVYCISIDALSYILPIYIYSKIMADDLVIVATIYVEFILQDRFALILSTTPLGYLIIYFIAMVLLVIFHAKDVQYISTHTKSLNWKPVLLFNCALFILMDTCYGAYYFLEELEFDTLSLPAIWLDCVVIISCTFSAGFSKLNVYLSKEHDNKLEYMQKFQDNQTAIIRDFASISEAKSGETGQHIRRVSEYAAILAKHFYEDETDINYIKVAAMMHDIGKLMIPNEIIEKKGKLTPAEYEIIKTHATYGNDLLSHNEGSIMTIARSIAYEHHERWDGKGYPRGLKGDEISLYAQLVSVADVYDALTSKRSYKEAWPAEEAKAEIIRQKGHQFSPKVVEAFEKSYDEIDKIRTTYAD